MAKSTCSLPECDKPRDYLGLCPMHAARLKRNGDPRVSKHRWMVDDPVTMRRRSRAAAKRVLGPGPCELEYIGGCLGRMHVHHIDENPLNNVRENLIRLCTSHHFCIHKGLVDLANPVMPEFYVSSGKRRYRKVA